MMPNSIAITDGTVEFMGDGVAVVLQSSDQGPQNVVLTTADLRAMLAAMEPVAHADGEWSVMAV